MNVKSEETTINVIPVDKGWFFFVMALCLFAILLNGFLQPQSWFILVSGWGLGIATILANPKKWLESLPEDDR